MRISDWSSDVCSSDLTRQALASLIDVTAHRQRRRQQPPDGGVLWLNGKPLPALACRRRNVSGLDQAADCVRSRRVVVPPALLVHRYILVNDLRTRSHRKRGLCAITAARSVTEIGRAHV